jgi:hypothetical protein
MPYIILNGRLHKVKTATVKGFTRSKIYVPSKDKGYIDFYILTKSQEAKISPRITNLEVTQEMKNDFKKRTAEVKRRIQKNGGMYRLGKNLTTLSASVHTKPLKKSSSAKSSSKKSAKKSSRKRVRKTKKNPRKKRSVGRPRKSRGSKSSPKKNSRKRVRKTKKSPRKRSVGRPRKTSSKKRSSKRSPKKSLKSSPKKSPKKNPRRKSSCSKSSLKKYTDRPGPPYPAQECRNQVKKGNDGLKYKSSPAVVKGKRIYRWKKV